MAKQSHTRTFHQHRDSHNSSWETKKEISHAKHYTTTTIMIIWQKRKHPWLTHATVITGCYLVAGITGPLALAHTAAGLTRTRHCSHNNSCIIVCWLFAKHPSNTLCWLRYRSQIIVHAATLRQKLQNFFATISLTYPPSQKFEQFYAASFQNDCTLPAFS